MIQPTLLLSPEEEAALTALCLREGQHVDRFITGLVLDRLSPKEAPAKSLQVVEHEAALLAKLNEMEKQRQQTRQAEIAAIAERFAPAVPDLKEEALHTGPTGERKFFPDPEPEP